MFDKDVDINLLAVAMAKNIAEDNDKCNILKIIHFLSLLQSALKITVAHGKLVKITKHRQISG